MTNENAPGGEQHENGSEFLIDKFDPVKIAKNGIPRAVERIKEHYRRMKIATSGRHWMSASNRARLDFLSAHVCSKKQLNGSIERCRLWKLSTFSIFPTNELCFKAGARQLLSAEQEQRFCYVQRDIEVKSRVAWQYRGPMHECMMTRAYNESAGDGDQWVPVCECNRSGGLAHCDAFAALLLNNFDSLRTSTQANSPALRNISTVDFSYEIYPKELQKDPSLVDSSVKGGPNDTVLQLTLCPKVSAGRYTIVDFAGIPGLTMVARYVVVQNLYFCPKSPALCAAHNCSIVGCATTDNMSGYSVCEMTGLILSMSGCMRMRDPFSKAHEPRNYRSSEQQDSIDLKRTAMKNNLSSSKGFDRAFLAECSETLQNVQYEAARRAESAKGKRLFDKIHAIERDGTGRRTRAERRTRKDRIKVLERMKDTDREARKMLATSHFSSPSAYLKEALHRIRILIGVGKRPQRAFAEYHSIVHWRETKERRRCVGVGHDFGGGVLPTRTKYVLEDDAERKTKDAEFENQRVGRRFNVAIKVIKNQKYMRNYIDYQVSTLARHAVIFWVLIRMRTKNGQKRPNMFPFSAFSVAFLYLLAGGVSLNVSRGEGEIVSDDNLGDEDEVEVLPRNEFVALCLPPRNQLCHIDNTFSSRDVQKCIRNVKETIVKHCITRRKSPGELSPFSKQNSGMDLEKKSSRYPTLFVGLRCRRDSSR